MHIVKDALLKARKSAEAAGEEKDGGSKPSVSPHVAMDFIRKALDAAAPWWQTQGAAPKNGERIVNSPVEEETKPSALGAGKHMEAMQRKAGARPPVGKLPDTPKGMDEALAMDGMAMDAGDMAAAATQMMSELEKHDKQHHPGGYKGGTCKLRDKVAQAAKNIGMSSKAVEKITNKSAGAEGGGSPDTEAPAPDDSPEFKEFDELRKNIMAETKAAGGGKSEEEQKALVKEAMGKLRSARFDYLTKALKMSPAEAGACSEIAEKVESGSEAAKKVVEELPDEQKKIVESVTATEETTVTGEGSEHADASGANEEQSDAQFADELKKLMPEKAAMVDKLTQNFDTLNDLLNDEQKKRFWELNEGGDEAAFYTFLGDECGFTADEVSALRDLTDAYRAANPADYPEYAEQHKHDELLSRVKKADRRLNNDVKRGKLSGIKNRLEIKGFSEEEIGQYMDAMGLTEEQKFAVVNDLPVPPKVPTDAELKKAELEKKASDAMEAYRKAHDEAKKNGKDKDPATIKDLNDKFKAAMEAKKAANDAPTAESAAEPSATAQAPAQQESSAPTETSGGGQEGNQAPTPKATKEESAAQPKDDPVAEGTSLQDHAAVCKANPKSNCPFLKAHMAPEALAALDKHASKWVDEKAFDSNGLDFDNNYYFVHRTSDDAAKQILSGDGFKVNAGDISGTAMRIHKPEDLKAMFDSQREASQTGDYSTDVRGGNTAVLIKIPKNLVEVPASGRVTDDMIGDAILEKYKMVVPQENLQAVSIEGLSKAPEDGGSSLSEAVPPDSSGGETATPAETAEPTTEAVEQQEPSREGGSKMPYEERRDELYQNIDKAYDAWNEAQRKYEEALNSGKSIIDPEVKELREKLDEAGDAVHSAITAFSDSLGTGREDDQAGGTAEPSETPEATAPNEAPPPLPIPPEPLPEYKPPKVGNSEVELDDDEKQVLDSLKKAYNDAPDGETREAAKQMYENYCAGLDQKAAMMQAAKDIEDDERARAEEQKRPGFIQNMKDFFGGIAKSMKGDNFVDLSDTAREQLGLPQNGKIRRSELQSALAKKAREAQQSKNDEANAPDWKKNGGVKTSTGNQAEVVTDSFLDRSQAKEGGLKDKSDATNKIKDVLAKASVDTSGLKDRVGPSDTTFTITTKDLTKKELEDIEKGIVRSLNRWDGKGNSKVKVSYNPQSSKLTVMIPHEKDEKGDLRFAKVFDSDEWKAKTKDMEIPMLFGEDENGDPVIADLADLVHLLVAGSTGSGKSSRMNTGIISMLMSRSPDQLGVWMIDPKRLEFTAYENDKHLLGNIAYSVEEADKTLQEATTEAENRRKLLQEVTRNTGLTIPDLKTYNKLAKEGKIPKEYPQFIKPAVVIIDEYSQLSENGGKDINKKIAELARLSRATGPHVIIATQRPDAKTIDGQIRSNLPSQLGLNTRSNRESEMIFGETGIGAENLAQRGPFILKTPQGDIVKGNGAHLTNEELDGYHREEAKTNNASAERSGVSSSTSATSRPSKPSSTSHVGNTTDGMEIHKSPDGKIFFKHNGRQYKMVRLRRKDGSVIEGWKLADGSDPRIFQLKPIST